MGFAVNVPSAAAPSFHRRFRRPFRRRRRQTHRRLRRRLHRLQLCRQRHYCHRRDAKAGPVPERTPPEGEPVAPPPPGTAVPGRSDNAAYGLYRGRWSGVSRPAAVSSTAIAATISSDRSGRRGRTIAAAFVVRTSVLADKSALGRCTVGCLRPRRIFARRRPRSAALG